MPAGVGSGVRALSARRLVAWVDTVAEHSISPSLERIRAHDLVTEHAMATGVTPVPARFGQIFASDDACRDALDERETRLLSDLARVAGSVEMRVIAELRGVDDAKPAAEPARSGGASVETPGRAYLTALVERSELERNLQTISSAVRRRLTETVGAFVRGEALSLDPTPTAVLTIAHLVPRDAVSRYRSALREAQFGHEVGRIVVSGPGAPYRFVSDPNE
jgi:hypothetical protein